MKKTFMSSVVISTGIFAAQAFSATYYVSPAGSDANSGTSINNQYKTISKAASVARAGDTVLISEGTYEETIRPANSGSSGSPIVFRANGSDKVVITAMQSLSGWQQDSGAVYKTSVNWNLGQENFVMNGATALDLARWPNNVDGDPFTLDSKRNTGGSGGNVGTGAYIDYAPGIPNIDWSQGGSVFFYGDKPGGGWLAWREFITSSNGTRINIDLSKKNPSWIRTAHAPADGGEFFLQGVRGALDYQNEWYFNANSNTLYVQLPNGVKPVDGQVKMRRRTTAVDLSNRSYIELHNLAVFGGTINITGNANHNLIKGVSSFYGNSTLGVNTGFAAPSYSINITGNDNRVEQSEIGYGSGSGYRDAGDRNVLINSYVHNFNTLGDYNGAILLRDGTFSNVTKNTLTRSGRATIQSNNRDSDFSYNDVSYANLVADDAGLFYTVGGPQRVKIHHNWFHDAYSHGTKKKACGIYLDNDAHSFQVYNNVIWNTEWTGIQINWDGTNIDVFNNTMWNNSETMGAWHLDGTAFSDVRVWNNLSDGNEWEPQSNKQNNITATGNPFVNSSAGDWRPRSGTSPVNAGRQISGYTDGFVGSAPDAGAYEFGGVNWKAGVEWDLKSGAAGRCYNLPGEDCRSAGGVVTIPRLLQAENYNNYFDTTAGNEGGVYRTDNVDIQATADTGGGYNIAWVASSEWLEYDVDASQAGNYSVDVRIASASGGGAFYFSVDGINVGSATNVPATGGYQSWQTVNVNLGYLTEGMHQLRLNVSTGDFNINWLDINLGGSPPSPSPSPSPGPTPPPSSGLVSNPGFETGNLNSWNGWGGPRTITGDAASGTSAARVQGAGAVSQIITGLTPNTTYVLSAKVKVANGNSANLGVKEYGGTEKASSVTNTNYASKSVSFTTGANNTQAQIYFYVPLAANVGFVDDVNVVSQSGPTPTPSPTPKPNLLQNGNFENGNLNPWSGWGGARSVVNDAAAGSYAAQAQGAGALYQVVTGLSPNTTYEYSAMVKVGNGDVAKFGVKEYGGAEQANNVTNTTYAKQTISFTTGANNTQAQVYFYIPANSDIGKIDEASVIVK